MLSLFTPFDPAIDVSDLPLKFTYPFDYEPHALSIIAVRILQEYLKNQKVWQHNFGLQEGHDGKVIGKMFGILLVKTAKKEIGFLSAFSGKLADSNLHEGFVPPVYDALETGSFLNVGMQELTELNRQYNFLEHDSEAARVLKQERKKKSAGLQAKLFDQYYFLNNEGVRKSLKSIFTEERNQKPPSAAGECAAPKLLQYAFQHQLTPIAMAEFWWGESPKSDQWKHKHFYPACIEKCQPILRHMLAGMEIEPKPNR
ncbi:MAG: tRNA pseudouridine32 synthase/23S rRNA pseudouridine746 synthase [Algoriphagus sp.]|jgi:tRNA pseudouridine32 synthase/23S rRNA pseudouridine746 synthase